jgi:hypothetical protein
MQSISENSPYGRSFARHAAASAGAGRAAAPPAQTMAPAMPADGGWLFCCFIFSGLADIV